MKKIQNHCTLLTNRSKEDIFTSPHLRARICKRLWSPGINSEESISPAYVAWRASTTSRVSYRPARLENRYLVSLKDLQIRALLSLWANRIKEHTIFWPIGAKKTYLPRRSSARDSSWARHRTQPARSARHVTSDQSAQQRKNQDKKTIRIFSYVSKLKIN